MESAEGVPSASRSSTAVRTRALQLRSWASGTACCRRCVKYADNSVSWDGSGWIISATGHTRAALGCPVSIGALATVLDEHPQVDLRLFVTDRPSSAVLSDSAEQGLDAALLVGPIPASSVVTRRLSRVRTFFAASRAYIEAHGAPKKPRDLSDHPCLCYIGERVQTEWSVFDRKGQETVVPVRGRFASSDSRALAGALLDGQGIGLALDTALADERLQRVLPKHEGPTLDVRLGYAASRRGSRRIDALAELLRPALQAI